MNLCAGLNLGYKNLDVTHPCRKVLYYRWCRSDPHVPFSLYLSRPATIIIYSAGRNTADLMGERLEPLLLMQIGLTEHQTSNALFQKVSGFLRRHRHPT